MPISLSIADVWKFFGERDQRKKEQISEWLFAVAKEGENLAIVWGQMATALQNGTAYDKGGFFSDLPMFNLMPFSILSQFYRTASTVLGGRVESGFHDQIAFILGSLMRQRQRALESYTSITANAQLKCLINPDNVGVNMSDLNVAVDALYKEAAALKVLAENFKAAG